MRVELKRRDSTSITHGLLSPCALAPIGRVNAQSPTSSKASFVPLFDQYSAAASINLLVGDTEPAARHIAQDAQGREPFEIRTRKVTTAMTGCATGDQRRHGCGGIREQMLTFTVM